jgi:hypothetical protein
MDRHDLLYLARDPWPWGTPHEAREFINLIGSATVWPLAANAQQRERIRRIGVLMNLAADDLEGQARNRGSVLLCCDA